MWGINISRSYLSEVLFLYLNVHEHGNVDEDCQEGDGRDVHRQVLPTGSDPQVNSEKSAQRF